MTERSLVQILPGVKLFSSPLSCVTQTTQQLVTFILNLRQHMGVPGWSGGLKRAAGLMQGFRAARKLNWLR